VVFFKPGLRSTLWTGLFVALLLAGLLGYGLFRFGSVEALRLSLQGHALHVEPAEISVGDLQPREQITVPVRLRNLTSGPLRVLGSHSTCGCLVAGEGLPTELASGEVRELTVQVVAPAKGPAEFETVVTFYVPVVGDPPRVILHGRVLPPQKERTTPGLKSNTQSGLRP
jgi:hypothetical protein